MAMLATGDDGGGNFVKRKMIYAALAVLALSAPAAAQGYGPGGAAAARNFTILRSTGLDPLASRCGADRITCCAPSTIRDREVRVVVSARSGDVLSVTPVQTASRMPPPRGGLTGALRADAAGLRAAGRLSRRRAGCRRGRRADIVRNPNAPRPPGACPARRRCVRAMPRRCLRAVVRCQRRDAPPLSEPNVITADPDRGGMLPPPPERFPQRAAPARRHPNL